MVMISKRESRLPTSIPIATSGLQWYVFTVPFHPAINVQNSSLVNLGDSLLLSEWLKGF
jgi:hypothetical protein